MAEINTLISLIGEAIASSEAISSWSMVEYGHGINVLENCDPQDEPEAEDCPLVVVYPLLKTGGLSQGNKTHTIGISCAVWDSVMPVSVNGVVRFTGGREVENLRGFVVDAIQSCIPADIHIEAIVTEYNTIEQFPFISANMDLTLTQEKLIGSDPLE